MGDHDLSIRVNQAKKFLDKGDKVRIEMMLRGREMAHQDLAREKIGKFIESMGEVAIEQPIKKQGRSFSVIINASK
jgi:translation initiation factor IF-3